MTNWLTRLFGGGKTETSTEQPAASQAEQQPAAPAAEETAATGEIIPEKTEEKPGQQL
jgi:hypothetical protein